MPYPETVAGEVGIYERWDPERHTEAFVELCGDPEVMRFLGGTMTATGAADVSERIAQHWQVFGFGLWAAIDPLDGRVAGFSGACKATWLPRYVHDVEIGWRLGRWAWGRGFATEGARLALEPAFAVLDLHEILSFVHPQNHRSQAVVDRLRMRRTGRTMDPRLQHPLEIFALRRPPEASAQG